MLTLLKQALRISHSKLDTEITMFKDACLNDLERVGIVEIDETDEVIKTLCVLYLKWQYNFEGEADRYRKAYEMMRDGYSMCGDYNVQSDN